jgi:hypothetical protein
VRAAFFLLLFVNLAFLAWAEWIDAPQPVPVNAEYARLPRLQLIDEVPHGRRPSSSAQRKTTSDDAPPPPAPTPVLSSAAAHCVSVGPFDDSAAAARAASVLQQKGVTPRQRSAEGEVSRGYWVYIGGLKTDHDVQAVLRTLEQSHVEDARVMPDTGEVHQVSVGLFSDRERAEHRAQLVRKVGLQPEVAVRRVPGTVFWMDVDLPSGAAVPDSQDLASQGATPGAGTAVQVVPCPTSAPSTPASPEPVPPAPEVSPTFRTKIATGTPKVP